MLGVINCNNLAQLKAAWDAVVLTNRQDVPRAYFEQDRNGTWANLINHLANHPRIQWFHYSDGSDGIALRLYDQNFKDNNQNDFKEKGASDEEWVVLRGKELGGTDGNCKIQMRQACGEDNIWSWSDRPNAGNNGQTRLEYFQAKNVAPPEPDMLVVRIDNIAQLKIAWDAVVAANHQQVPNAHFIQDQNGLFQQLVAHLAQHPRIQWYSYTDGNNGIALRLYDQEFMNQFPGDFVANDLNGEGWVVLQGVGLGAPGEPCKQGMRAAFGANNANLWTWGNRPNPGDQNQTRIQYFQAKNVPPPSPPMSSERELAALVKQFRQVILYGPPGTGKTRLAKRAALELLQPGQPQMKDGQVEAALTALRINEQRFNLVVFHPSYEYEHFIGGISPQINAAGGLTYSTEPGVFLKLCLKAQIIDKPVLLIIDEINRGNLPKLLGELIYSLEYRGENNAVELPFNYRDLNGVERDSIFVPKNLYIIATMNSSDRSIGHIDAAVRRRFPQKLVGPDREAVISNWSAEGAAEGDGPCGILLAGLMLDINSALEKGELGKEIGVGHSYFLCDRTNGEVNIREQVRRKWEYQVLPLLNEYRNVTSLESETVRRYSDRLQQILGNNG